MKKIVFIITFFLIPAVLPCSLSGQTVQGIRIIKGRIDTVATALHTIVGNTFPGSNIRINGIDTKQFKTGSFGGEVKLTPGDNKINIRVLYKGQELQESFNVYFKEKVPDQPLKTPSVYCGKSVITLPGAYFNYGTGEDRLGGAKINYVDEGIRMEVLDSAGDLFKVRLSEKNYAYIPKSFTAEDDTGQKPPFSLTGSWSVSNRGKSDAVRISLGSRQPYFIRFEKESGMILADIFGAACNSNWISQYQNTAVVDYVDFEQREPDVFRVKIKLKEGYLWGYEAAYEGTALVISVKHCPVPRLKNLIVGVDAGHGGSSSGAVSPSGVQEKDLNLAMAFMLRGELLKRGAKVVMSRTDDRDLTMAERKRVFSEAGVDLLVSVHCNAGGNPLMPGGTSTYYRHVEYRDLAVCILNRLLKKEGIKNFGLVGNFNFALNAPTYYPSVLVETLFMSSLPDEEMLLDVNNQREMMQSVAKGIGDYLKIVRKSTR